MEWRAIPGFEGYEITRNGDVRSLDRYDVRGHWIKGRELRKNLDGVGYLTLSLSKNGRSHKVGLHRALLMAFVGPPAEGADACHNDGDKTNNSLSNLRWDTRKNNIQDAIKHGTHWNAGKTHCIRGHEFTEWNIESSNSGRRNCKACSMENHNRKKTGREFDPERADQHYNRLRIRPAKPLADRTHCPREHPLVEGNLIPSVAKKGGRSCLACSRARAYAQRNNLGFQKEIADDYFRKLEL